jgi:hypothetical protein
MALEFLFGKRKTPAGAWIGHQQKPYSTLSVRVLYAQLTAEFVQWQSQQPENQ